MNKDDIIREHQAALGKSGHQKLKDSMTPEEYKKEMTRRSKLATAKRWGDKNAK